MVAKEKHDGVVGQSVIFQLLQDSPHQRRVRYLEGKEVSRGGCLVETRCGVIDGRRETRAALLREAVSA